MRGALHQRRASERGPGGLRGLNGWAEHGGFTRSRMVGQQRGRETGLRRGFERFRAAVSNRQRKGGRFAPDALAAANAVSAPSTFLNPRNGAEVLQPAAPRSLSFGVTAQPHLIGPPAAPWAANASQGRSQQMGPARMEGHFPARAGLTIAGGDAKRQPLACLTVWGSTQSRPVPWV